MARGYDVGRPEWRVECGVRPPRCRGEEHPPTTRHPPPTPKMGLEETLALTPAPPRRGGSTHSSRNFTPFGVELLHGDSRRRLPSEISASTSSRGRLRESCARARSGFGCHARRSCRGSDRLPC